MTPADTPRILLLGDSHLARLGATVPALGPGVTNRARGGAFSSDLAGQVRPADLAGVDVVVVSVGTNDAAPWKQVPLADGVDHLRRLVAGLPCPVVLLAPPGVDESRLVRAEDRTNDRVGQQAAAFARVVAETGGRVVDASRLLADLGPDAFVEDGVHLTPAAYAVLLPALADAVAEVLAVRSSDDARRS